MSAVLIDNKYQVTDDHVREPFLLLHNIIHVSRYEGLSLVEIVLPFFAFSLRRRMRIREAFRNKFLHELHDGIDQWRRLRSFLL